MRPRRWAAIAALSALLASPVSAARDAPIAELLDAALSPGTAARLFPHAENPAVQDRWAEGIHHSDPRVRAVCARLAGLANTTALRDDLREALRGETDLAAATEQLRALDSLIADPADPDLFDAARRLGEPLAGILVEILVIRRGLGGLRSYLEELPAQGYGPGAPDLLVRAVLAHDPRSIDEMGEIILRGGHEALWRALMDVMDRENAAMSRSLLHAALRHPYQAIRGETAWMLFPRFSAHPPPDAKAWLSSLEEGEASVPDESDSDLAFGCELLGRALGRPPRSEERWIEYLAGENRRHMARPKAEETVMPHLLGNEAEILEKREEDPATATNRVEYNRTSLRPVIRTVSGFPAGLVSDLVAITRCPVPHSQPRIIEADVRYDERGRPRSVTFAPKTAKQCRELATLLFSTSLAPRWHLPDQGNAERLVLFLERGFLQRLEEDTLRAPSGCCTKMQPPRRTRYVKPEYPVEAKEQHAGGNVVLDLVVNRQGKVNDIRLVASNHHVFTLSAMWAVSQWEYEPATTDGEPVASSLTVITEYGITSYHP